MSDEQGKQEFKVVDKRRFTSEGDSRTGADAPAEPVREQPQPAKAQPQSVQPAERKTVERAQASPAESGGAHEGSHQVDFASFVVSLATQALLMLGEIPAPDGEEVDINLDAARQTIEILAMLEEKTKGNLSGEENRLISEVLSSLRLTYVKKLGTRK